MAGEEPRLSIAVDQAGLRAEAAFQGPGGAELVTPELIESELRARGVVLSEAVAGRVRAFAAACATASDGRVAMVVAEAARAKPGQDGRLVFEPGMNPAGAGAPAPGGDGPGSHYDRTGYIMARAGQRIARIVGPTAGEAGVSVLGRAIPARSGKPALVRTDGSIERRPDGSLLAAADGLLRFERGLLRVLPVLETPGHVDFSTGNIEFRGDVVVGKGVRDCFEVRATGDVQVRGLVEAATIEAGRDARLEGGMAAREKGGLRAGRDLFARYLDGVTAWIGRSVSVDREMVNCRLTVGGSLKAPRGAIVGGSCRVAGACEVDQLGGESAARTELSLGTIAEVDDLRSRVSEVLPAIEGRRAKFGTEHESLVRNASKLTPSQAERMTELQFELDSMRQLAARCDASLKKLSGVEGTFAELCLTVHGWIHRGVRVRLRGYDVEFERELCGSVRITLGDDGRPVCLNLSSGSVTDLRELARVVPREEDAGQPGRQAA